MTEQNRDRQGAENRRYLITFTCYGAWLHGKEGSVDRKHNAVGSRFQEADPRVEKAAANLMKETPYRLDEARRKIVLDALKYCCERRGWYLYAAHVRTNHAHVVIASDRTPELALNALKAYAGRGLNDAGIDEQQRRWARHGNTRYLWTDKSLSDAIRYVVHGQGEPMAVFGV